MGMAAIERADAAPKGEIKLRNIDRKYEVFGRGAQGRQSSILDLFLARALCRCDPCRRTVHDEDMPARSNLAGNNACRDSRSAANLKYPQTRSQREGIDNSLKSSR